LSSASKRNRYPGARFDSESWSYGFSFSKEVLDEWTWSEHFAGQPEILRYASFLTDKFDLRRDMIFNTQIVSAQYQSSDDYWLLTDQNGKQYTCRYLISAMGILNQPTPPNIPGVNDFKNSWHTSRWPKDDSSLKGKRVGIIGTGATGIQVIQSIAKDVGSLTVFQRTPNWAAPLRNSPISSDEMQDIRKRYPEIFEACMKSSHGFVHLSTPDKTVDMDPAEREARWEALYARPGFAKFLGVNTDIFTDREASTLYSDFMAKKIKDRVHNPVTAEKLVPKCHLFGTRRVPLETNYFEVYNQPNVTLVDLKEQPIEKICEQGVQTTEQLYELDILIYATGFDATTGSFRAVDIRGRNNKSLTDVWSDGIKTQLGLTVKDFPNFLMIMGPHQVRSVLKCSLAYGHG
jgi:cation diffusion facilitator CzcD-associated flavoprotein CzcO